MFSGVIFFSLSVGFITTLLQDLDKTETALNTKLNLLNEIRYIYEVDEAVHSRVRHAVMVGMYKTDEDLNSLSTLLPDKLSVDLNALVYRPMMDEIMLLKNLNDEIVAEIGPKMVQINFHANERIYVRGEYANEMFFVKLGTVALILEDFNDQVCVKVGPGGYFGEIELIYGSQRYFTYKALSKVELYSLENSSFTTIFFKKHRELGNTMKHAADDRLLKQREIVNTITDIYGKDKIIFAISNHLNELIKTEHDANNMSVIGSQDPKNAKFKRKMRTAVFKRITELVSGEVDSPNSRKSNSKNWSRRMEAGSLDSS